MHWADVAAGDLAERGERHFIATGITPSGPIHVGNLREILTGHLIWKACQGRDLDATLYYIGDTFDPLRKVYPFLDAEVYEDHVGKVLSNIPCPCDDHPSYAHHFLEPFFDSIESLGVHPEILLAHELYDQGRYADIIRTFIAEKERVSETLVRIARRGKPLADDWFPYNPICSTCGRLDDVKVSGFDDPYVSYSCAACETEDRADIRRAEGKLPWRLDWPARWKFLGITCEPFGKDHAAAGGSYDTGVVFLEQILGGTRPRKEVYEWIKLRGTDMHSSTGTGVAAEAVLGVVPPEIIRYLVTRSKPKRHLEFDTGMWLIHQADAFQKLERRVFKGKAPDTERRIWELSLAGDPPEELPIQITFGHLVDLVQLEDDVEGALARLQATGKLPEGKVDESFKQKVEVIRNWVASEWCPAELKIIIQADISTEMQGQLNQRQREYLDRLASVLEEIIWEDRPIHGALHDLKKQMDEESTFGSQAAFSAIYRALLNRDRGPTAGYLISKQDRSWVVRRFRDMAGS